MHDSSGKAAREDLFEFKDMTTHPCIVNAQTIGARLLQRATEGPKLEA